MKIILFQLKNKAAWPRLTHHGQVLSKLTPEMGGQERLEKESKKRLPRPRNTGTKRERCCQDLGVTGVLKTQHSIKNQIQTFWSVAEAARVVTFPRILESSRLYL